jgi:hypothetical protein
VKGLLEVFRHTAGALKIAATDDRIPKPLRGLVALGLLPIPGPFDEALLVLVAVPLALFYRRPLAEAWARAGQR